VESSKGRPAGPSPSHVSISSLGHFRYVSGSKKEYSNHVQNPGVGLTTSSKQISLVVQELRGINGTSETWKISGIRILALIEVDVFLGKSGEGISSAPMIYKLKTLRSTDLHPEVRPTQESSEIAYTKQTHETETRKSWLRSRSSVV